jgi:hypothetical protein
MKQKYDAVVFFEKRIVFRIKGDEIKTAKNIIKNNREKYENLSHYIRCAVIQLNRKEKKNVTPKKLK